MAINIPPEAVGQAAITATPLNTGTLNLQTKFDKIRTVGYTKKAAQ